MILIYGTNIELNKVIGFLDATSALITENTDGDRYCELECKNTAENSKYFKKDILIRVTGEHGGVFRIGAPIKTGGKLKAKCLSLFYDTENYIISSLVLENVTVAVALERMATACDGTVPLKFLTGFPNDITVTLEFKDVTLKTALKELQKQVGGHYIESERLITLYQNIGKNNGTVLRYADNVISFSATEDWSEVCTKIKPIGKDGITLDEVYLESETQYDVPYTKVKEFEQDIEIEGDINDSQFSAAVKLALKSDLKSQGEEYLATHSKPTVNYDIEAHIKTPVHIGDVCQVIYPKLSVNSELQVIETKWNGVSHRYESVQFGTLLPSINGLYSRLGGK